MKLTDKGYRLPIIEALGGFGLMESGTTQPMRIRGVDVETGSRDHFVVKFRNGNRMSEKACAFELIGAWMAMELDIPVVEPVLVNIGEEFTSTILGKPGYTSAIKSVGINFGSRYREGYSMLVKSPSIVPNTMESMARNIFTFDQFISNADRSHNPAQKPNVLSDGNQYLILDHEMAFSFLSLLSFLRNKTPWLLGPSENEMLIGHIFYPYLRQRAHDFKPFCERLVCFNDEFWSKANSFMPDSWKGDFLLEIQSYLGSITENKETFAEELTKHLLP